MSRSLSRVGPVLAVLALFAVPSMADVFFVTLTNGTVIETARQPQQASWDPNMVLLLTEVGNWVGFPKEDVKNVRSEDPTQGFGIKISDKAIALGRAPNDLPTDPAKVDPNSRYLDIMQRQLALAEARLNYSVQQFVDPGSSSGVPISYDGSNSFGSFGANVSPYSNTPSNDYGPNSGIAFGGLTGIGSPPDQ